MDMVQKSVQPIENQIQSPRISPYQKALLAELKKRPEVMNLLTAIFRHLPALVVKEFRQTNDTSSDRQKRLGFETMRERLKCEAWIEEEIAKLAGIPIAQLKNATPEEPKNEA